MALAVVGGGWVGQVYACEAAMDLSVLALRQTIMAVATGKPTACYLPPAPCRLLLPHIINLVRPHFGSNLT